MERVLTCHMAALTLVVHLVQADTPPAHAQLGHCHSPSDAHKAHAGDGNSWILIEVQAEILPAHTLHSA
jgi:hypothetical protein